MNISARCVEVLLCLYKGVNRTGLLDLNMIRSLYISSYFTYKKYLEDSYARLVKHHGYLFSGGNILDIGANIGYTSYVFSKIVEHQFKIFAFEPEERNIMLIKQGSQKYRFSEKMVIIPAALGDKEGEFELWNNEAHNGDHRILTDELKKQLKGQFKIQKIPMVTVDNYLAKQEISRPISFVKIDVQGYELPVCKGMKETLIQNPNIVIGFEYCPSVIESLGFQPEELLSFFQEKGYQFYVLHSDNKIKPYDLEQGHIKLQEKKLHDYIDILCSKRNLSS